MAGRGFAAEDLLQQIPQRMRLENGSGMRFRSRRLAGPAVDLLLRKRPGMPASRQPAQSAKGQRKRRGPLRGRRSLGNVRGVAADVQGQVASVYIARDGREREDEAQPDLRQAQRNPQRGRLSKIEARNGGGIRFLLLY